MSPKIKNILIFAAIAVILVLAYIYFMPGGEETPDLVSSSSSTPDPLEGSPAASPAAISPAAADFLSLLLSVRSIKLDDSVFSHKTFGVLRDSTIILERDGNEGRPNPFAPIGSDTQVAPTEPAVIESIEQPIMPPDGAETDGIDAEIDTLLDSLQ